MATRGSMRAWLRRRLMETTPRAWGDSTLNEYLNTANGVVQEFFELLEPGMFAFYESTTDLTTAPLIPLPDNCKTPRRLQRKTTATGDYVDLAFVWYEDTLPAAGDTAANLGDPDPVWALQGANIRLLPVWTASTVADGLRLTYTPFLTMSTDAQISDIPLNGHFAVVLVAQLIALADVAPSTEEISAVSEALATEIKRLSVSYNRQLPATGIPSSFRISPRAQLGSLIGAADRGLIGGR